MGQLGNLFQILGLVSGFAAFGMYVYAMQTQNKSTAKTADMIMIGQLVAFSLASCVLIYALATGYFKMEYVAQYTDLKLPFIYKISGWWAGQAGSLLFWGWLVAVFAVIEIFRTRNYDTKYRSTVLAVSALTSTFFLILTIFVTNPFKELDFFPADGMGMNPLLQNPGMLYHPPTLFLGYVGYTITVGHAFAALFNRDSSSNWFVDTRKWTIITWVFLTIGIVLGGEWAYVELGWGGYWAWDPVENASLLPWLTSTALLHSGMVFERRNKLKIWTHMLALISFQLCLFGTFITRSGVLDSVHSFAKSSLGYFFLAFIVITSAVFLYYLFKMIDELKDKDEHQFSFLSRDGMFFLANWFFLGLTIVIGIGTMMPIISGLILPDKITVGIPYFNKVSAPFFVLILLASGIAPLLGHGKAETKDLVKKFAPSVLAMIAAVAALVVTGHTQPLPILLTGFTTFSLVAILVSVITNVKKGGVKVLVNNRRYYGGLIIHLGVVMMAYGIIASSFYNDKKDVTVAPGESFEFSGYTLKVGELAAEERANYVGVYAPVTVFKNGKELMTLAPERRFYEKNEQAFAEVAISSKLHGDLYLILASYSKTENFVGIQAVFQPFIAWVWIGCIVMVIGGLYGATGGKKKNA
ncbi:heme lyase CcmF/NrfE family subunit [Seleniivibrio woodruffii]|uniref:Cytochrome c-type biogenesis protein CcmF n=1 Tax=Seleniivibrio woodruffii TaxID=1078050 RepID=A0A4R1K5D3_9BACT|nr:heme lyase CcmF/NrfE family subunit [Seleniivibrio woodruffii]TCK59388.1 cytochrome c-type biogenesis protein CcmF [Seleniivibrio woodruffii]TVZ35571.1 cytochrome c-type biogenesis protein CcmF [Seleniivibrio woodruffii]